MKKALDNIKVLIKHVDAIIYLVDARAYKASVNFDLLNLFANKKVIFVITKTDLADPSKLDTSLKYYKEQGYLCLTYSNKLTQAEFIRRFDALNIARPRFRKIRMLICGVPNVGKSSLIRTLTKAKLNIADRPGVTRIISFLSVNDKYEVIDTPGLLPPKISDENSPILALINAINLVNIHYDCVKYLLNILREYYPDALRNRYQLTELDDDSIITRIKTKYSVKDEEEVFKIIFKDYQANYFGQVNLEHD
jgi:ribosome biogenesis GTPase A